MHNETKKEWDFAELKKKMQAKLKTETFVVGEFDIVEVDKVKASVTEALLEDEIVRRDSERNSREYLNRIDEEESKTPFWMWCALYFALGVLFTITVDNVTFGWIELSSFWDSIIASR